MPTDWVTATLEVAERSGADVVAGMAELSGWDADDRARAAYDALIQQGMTEDGGHRHLYAANLALRYPAFAAAGGFPPVAHGEERVLVAAIRAAGGSVVSTLRPVVSTSARMPGRAAQGLGALLARLAAAAEPPDDALASLDEGVA